jgi:lysophospholipase L1-like esterase
LRRRFTLALLAALPLLAQPAAPIDDKQALALYQRSFQLIEAAGFAIPDLARAGQPITENMRQTLESLQFLGFRNPDLHYRMINNLRTYLLISDAVPKPVPYPEAAKKQLSELRDVLNQAESYFQAQVNQIERQLRDPDRDQLARYQEANARAGQPKAGKPRVVFLGDSITDFWPLNEYFPDKDFHNRGISGQITSQMLARFFSDVKQINPAGVLVLAGTNDIARGVSMDVVQSNLTVIADLADTYKIKPIFASILPVNDYQKNVNPNFERTRYRPLATIVTLNNWLKSFCEKRGYTFLNYYLAMADPQGFLQRDLADDGLHPNSRGYRIMAPLALDAIERAFTPPQPEKKKKRLF